MSLSATPLGQKALEDAMKHIVRHEIGAVRQDLEARFSALERRLDKLERLLVNSLAEVVESLKAE